MLRVLTALTLAASSSLVAATSAVATTPTGAVVTKVGGFPVKYGSDRNGLTEAAHGTATTLTVDYSTAAAGTWTIDWTCGSGPWDHHLSTVVPDDAPDGVVVYAIDTSAPSTHCTFLVQGPGMVPYFVRLLQLDPIAVDRFKSPTGPTVYPTVTADSWIARFQTNSPADVTTTVRNRAGKIVFTGKSAARRAEKDIDDVARVWYARVAWNGRRTNGSLVPLGTYRVRIAVTSTRGSGKTVIGPLKVAVKPGRRPITTSASRAGWSGEDFASGGCFAADQINYAVWLNCSQTSGGSKSVAQATYTFTVPRSATLNGWKVSGGVGGDDNSAVGSITKTMSRPDARTIKIRVKVTGKRSFVVDSVRISYTYLK